MRIIKIITVLLMLTTLGVASQPSQEAVAKLYVATFNRAPDAGGLSYWTNDSFDGSPTLAKIAKSFFEQEETQKLYPAGTSNASFISSVYQNLFNREVETAGLNYWEDELNRGVHTRDSFIQVVIEGAQDNEDGLDKTILQNKTSVGLSFAEAQLDDLDDAKAIMSKITADVASVTAALQDFGISTPLNPSDEKYYKYLWHIDSQNSAKEKIAQEVDDALGGEYEVGEVHKDADINILEAWKITRGKGVVVAVIDDGADVNHEDLQENILLTYNADNETTDISNTSNDIEVVSHGNTCAGFVAAPINGTGIIGSAPESKLMLIKQDEIDDAKSIRAFEYAKNNGAKVISCSWGTENVSQAVESQIKSLYDAGITVVFASGNDGKSLDESGIEDESELEWVIGVGASGENNDLTSYSNYGKNIDILATGGDDFASLGILGLDDSGTQGSISNYGLVSNSYAFTSGTSYATPVLAGVVALMYSVNPNLTPKQVREILISTADKIGGKNANYINGFDAKRAYGKVNALRAVQEAKKLLK